MASNLLAMASNPIAMAWNLLAAATNLLAMATNLLAMGWPPACRRCLPMLTRDLSSFLSPSLPTWAPHVPRVFGPLLGGLPNSVMLRLAGLLLICHLHVSPCFPVFLLKPPHRIFTFCLPHLRSLAWTAFTGQPLATFLHWSMLCPTSYLYTSLPARCANSFLDLYLSLGCHLSSFGICENEMASITLLFCSKTNKQPNKSKTFYSQT